MTAAESAGITLVDWLVFELLLGERHFVGWDETDNCGRVSSPIVAFDARKRQGISSSGGHYHLAGPPGEDSDAEYTFDAWCRDHGVDRDTASWVTDEYV